MHDPDCTFKPKITARSANLHPRSVVELSRGDQLKRETTQRLTRLRAEQVLAVYTLETYLRLQPRYMYSIELLLLLFSIF